MINWCALDSLSGDAHAARHAIVKVHCLHAYLFIYLFWALTLVNRTCEPEFGVSC